MIEKHSFALRDFLHLGQNRSCGSLVGDSPGLNSDNDNKRYFISVLDLSSSSSEVIMPCMTIRFDILHTFNIFISGIKGQSIHLGGLEAHDANTIHIGIEFGSGMHMGGMIICDAESYPDGIPEEIMDDVIAVFMKALHGIEVVEQRFKPFTYQPWTVTFPLWTIKMAQILDVHDAESPEASDLADGVENLSLAS